MQQTTMRTFLDFLKDIRASYSVDDENKLKSLISAIESAGEDDSISMKMLIEGNRDGVSITFDVDVKKPEKTSKA